MQTDPEILVVQAENSLNSPSATLREVIKTRTADVVDVQSLEGVVQFWAIVKVEGASTGVSKKPVIELSLTDLYGYNQSTAVAFASEIKSIGKRIDEILLLQNDDLEFDLTATSLWGRLKQLNRFLGVSQFHDELIMTFHQLAASEAPCSPSVDKLQALKTVISKLSLKVRLSDGTLDIIYDELEAAGFDLSSPF